jgi:drug/metabolite transporter (DMT)-like permease
MGPSRPEAQRSGLLAGILCMAAGDLIFVLSDAGAKGLMATYPPLQVLFFRSLLTLVPVALIAWRGGGARSLATRRPFAHLGRAAVVTLAMFATVEAYARLPLADAYAILLTIPLAAAALSHPILGERVTTAQWLTIGLGFAGGVVIVDPSPAGIELGALFALVGSVCFGLFRNLTRRLSRTETNAALMLSSTLVTVAASGCAAALDWVPVAPSDVPLILFVGLSAGAGQYLLTQAFRLAPVAVVGPMDYVALIAAAIVGYLVWGDVPGLNVWIGSSIITLAGVFLIRGLGR